jgi:hypothetical protein
MTNLAHIMPKPVVVPIFWGHAYAAHPATAKRLETLISDLVTGPYLNVLAQYGVQRGSMAKPIIIDDIGAPATLTYTDTNDTLVDQVTQKLISWIDVLAVPPPPSPTDVNHLYVILPPTHTTLFYHNGSDTIGQGVQGFHSAGRTNPAGPPAYNWTIVKTNDKGDPATTVFVDNLAQILGHEIAEQCADINGSWGEVGDACNNTLVTYRGWPVQQLWSDWSGRCENGDSPISLKTFANAIGFDLGRHGLRALGVPKIDVDFIALRMQSQPAPAPPPG